MKHTLLAGVLELCLLLTGCAGTTVIYQPDDLPGSEEPPRDESTSSGAVKTGLAIVADISGSQNAAQADYDVTVVAVMVDDAGVIRDCIVDGISTTVPFDTTGTITGDLGAEVLTKNELGEDYGMKQYGGAKYEWYQQAAALASYAVGKTAGQLRSGAIDESGYAADADLATSATIYLGGLVSAIDQAVQDARELGASAGDELRLAVLADRSGSTSAAAGEAGRARLNCDAAALTLSGNTITSCSIDSLQADVGFDVTGTITNDLSAAVKTKRELGEDYGMKRYGGAKYEWYEQANHFADYVTGRTAVQIMSIPTTDGKPAEADLYTSVTISITPFQKLVAKACGDQMR